MRAQEAGIRRQKVEMLLPQAGVTSAQGSWPGGIRQQAQVAIPTLIEPLLRQLKQQEALQVFAHVTTMYQLVSTSCVHL